MKKCWITSKKICKNGRAVRLIFDMHLKDTKWQQIPGISRRVLYLDSDKESSHHVGGSDILRSIR